MIWMRLRGSASLILVAGSILSTHAVALAATSERPTFGFYGFSVLGIADDEAALLAREITQTLSQEQARLSFVAGADLRIAGRCAGDWRCLCAAAERDRVDYLLTGNLGRLDRIYTIELFLVERGSCTKKNQVFWSDDLATAAAVAKLRSLAFELVEPVLPRAAADAAPTMQAPTDTVAVVSPPVAEARTAPATANPTAAWIVIGVGSVGLVSGSVLAWLSRSASRDADRHCRSLSGQTLCDTQARAAIDRQRRYSVGADVVLGIGVAALAVGVPWLWHAGANDAVGATVVVSESARGVTLVGSW